MVNDYDFKVTNELKYSIQSFENENTLKIKLEKVSNLVYLFYF